MPEDPEFLPIFHANDLADVASLKNDTPTEKKHQRFQEPHF